MTTNTNTTAAAIIAAYAEPERRAGRAITNNANKTYSPMLESLRQSWSNDHAARLAPYYTERAAEERAAAQALQDQADKLQAYAERLTITRQEAATAAKQAKTLRTQASTHTKAAEDFDRLLDCTLSERADLAQAAALALLEEPTDTERAAAERTADESGEEWTEEQIAAAALKRHATNAAQSAIRAAAHPDANNSHTTKLVAVGIDEQTNAKRYKMTAAEVEQWERKHSGTGAKHKEPQPLKRMRESDCYDTVEWKTYKSRPQDNGFYRIRHYISIAPYTSIDLLTDEGTLDHYTKSRTQYAETQGAMERLEELTTAANLTERERLFIAAFISTTAATKGAKARQAYYNAARLNGTAPSRTAANNAEYAARIAWAFTAKGVGITNENTRRQFFKRLRDRLETARPATEPQTAAERQEQNRRAMERLQANRHRGHAEQTAHTLREPYAIMESRTTTDESGKLCTYWTMLHETAAHNGGVIWTDRAAHLAAMRRHSRTAAERAAQSRIAPPTAEQAQTAADLYTAAKWRADIEQARANHKSRTAFPHLNAANAAAAFMPPERESLAADLALVAAYRAAAPTIAADRARATAEQEQAAADLAAAKAAAANWSNRPAHRMTAAQFNATPPAARIALLDSIHADGKRLEIIKA